MNEDLIFIKKFQKIKLSKICDNLKISRTNLYTGRMRDDKIKLVRLTIEEELLKLYLENSGKNE